MPTIFGYREPALLPSGSQWSGRPSAADPSAIFWIDEGADVRHAERTEELLALGCGEPVVRVLHVVVRPRRWSTTAYSPKRS